MYIISDKLAKVSSMELQNFGFPLPKSYEKFLIKFGRGTYRGLFEIDVPNTKRMQDFSGYEDFWIFDESIPITPEQLKECIALVTSIDGDLLVMHPKSDPLLLFPRHSDEISLYEVDESNFCEILDSLFLHLYQVPLSPAYFEPWNQQENRFMRFEVGEIANLQELAKRYNESFSYDFLLESEYSCRVFQKQFGGYVRFNYTNNEVGIFYDADKEDRVEENLQFLKSYCVLI